MIGVSGSGKSTYAHKLRQRICNTDRFIDTYANALGVKYGESFDQIQLLGLFGELINRFHVDIEDAIKGGEDFIVDRTNITKKGRMDLIQRVRSIAKEYNKDIIVRGIVFDVSRETILDRLILREKLYGKTIPQDVINNQFDMYEVPDIKEGFDVLEQIHV